MSHHNHEAILMNKPNVVGYSQKGRRRIVNGQEVDEQVLRVYVTRKVLAADLTTEEFIPSTVDGLPTDVVAIGELKAQPLDPSNPRTGAISHLFSSISVGHRAITSGTMARIVTDSNGVDYVLSNAHVLAPSSSQPGDDCFQPGPYYHEEYPNSLHESWKFGQLVRSVPIVVDGSHNSVDCAIASITDRKYNVYGTMELGSFYVKGAKDPEVGQFVTKEGVTTSLTQGQVFDDAATVDIAYAEGTARFVDQILIRSLDEGKAFSKGGDSGSIIYLGFNPKDDGAIATALLFAGNEQMTVANPITKVLKALRVGFRPNGTELPVIDEQPDEPEPPVEEPSNAYSPATLVLTFEVYASEKTSVLVAQLSETRVSPGTQLFVNGYLLDANTNAGLSNREIIGPEGIGAATTADDGSFALSMVAPETVGTYELRISFLGDND